MQMQQDPAFARDNGAEQSSQNWPNLEGEKGGMLEQGVWSRSPFGLADSKVLMLDTLKISPSPMMLT